jgi:MATE family multidrug resistance protein
MRYNVSNIVSELKCSLKLAVPLITSEMIYALNGFFATVMVAHLGKEQLAANALVWSFYIAVIVFFMGPLCATSIMVSHSFGAKDSTGISICFKQGLIMAILLSLPMMLIISMIPNILVWIKQDSKIIQYAKPLCYSLVWPMLPLNVMVIIQQFLVGIAKIRLVIIMSIIAVPIEIFFYYTFLFGKFGIPQIGLSGIGYGLTASYSIISLYFIGYLTCSKTLKIYNLFKKWWSIETNFLLEMIRVGLPLGAMWCSELAFFSVVAIMMGYFGVSTLAAFQIADQYLMIATVILFAICQSTSIRIGNEVGKNNRIQLPLITTVNIAIGITLISIFSIIYMLFPETAISLDIDLNSSNLQEVIKIAITFFPMVALTLLVDCFRIITNGALRGLKDTNIQMLISIAGFWVVAFPTSYILGFKYNYEGIGIWWGIIIGLIITGIMLLIRLTRLVQNIDLSSLVTKKISHDKHH